MDTKKGIRTEIRKLRDQMDPIEWNQKTDEIMKVIMNMDLFREATDLYCYVDFGREVGTRILIQEAWKLGKTVWVPRVTGDNMDFFEITSFEQLAPGTFGVMEPKVGIPAEGRDGLMIVPGVAFDKHRNRIGYGKGYYDKYIASHPRLLTVAVAFDLQVLEEVPAESTDIRPQILITESKTYSDR